MLESANSDGGTASNNPPGTEAGRNHTQANCNPEGSSGIGSQLTDGFLCESSIINQRGHDRMALPDMMLAVLSAER